MEDNKTLVEEKVEEKVEDQTKEAVERRPVELVDKFIENNGGLVNASAVVGEALGRAVGLVLYYLLIPAAKFISTEGVAYCIKIYKYLAEKLPVVVEKLKQKPTENQTEKA